MLKVKHVSKSFNGLPIIGDLSLDVRAHEIVALVGPSGCGKSTLLNLISGIDDDYEGTIETDGEKVGYVFQEDRVLPWRTVYENLKLVREDTDDTRIAELIHKMHLDGFEDYYPDQLSGGMRQRCGIARAFYYGSDLLLMDEPFKSLDHILRQEMLENLIDSWESENSSVLFVTHDLDEALMIADRILIMKERPTRVLHEICLPREKGKTLRDLSTPELVRTRKELIEILYFGTKFIKGAGEMTSVKTEDSVPKLGIDLGASSIKIVLMQDNKICYQARRVHYGQIFAVLSEELKKLKTEFSCPMYVRVTGANADSLVKALNETAPADGNSSGNGNDFLMDEIPAITAGVHVLYENAGCIIEIGSQAARFITDLDKLAPQFAVNEHCAGGTGSFFEDQMSRLGLKIEDYSSLVEKAKSVPRLSGRCSVFAKTDIIHRQQEGVPTPDILLGLCYAMIRNYRAVIVRSLPVTKPVVVTGGITENSGAVRAIKDVFSLEDDELIIPDNACFSEAIGAALYASRLCTADQILTALSKGEDQQYTTSLPKLVLKEGTRLQINPASGDCSGTLSLGIDIGSTSTDLVIVNERGELVDEQYLRTAGNPEKAVRDGLASIEKRYGKLKFHAVGVTGSGRERVGLMIGADAVRDEITAQARGAYFCDPEVDTVFEIGGQDSKYIMIRNGQVVDFQMNKICAAGTGSFVEEQAARMNIPIDNFGDMALKAEKPAQLGERCTVFIETAIASAVSEGVSEENIAAGLCYAIVRNYLHKVVGSKPVGQHIVLQGGVNYNGGIVAAFQHAYGDRVHVSPCFSISGALGVALLAAEEVGENGISTFHGFEPAREDKSSDKKNEEIRRNIEFYEKAGKLLLDGYDGSIDPNKKTVGIPYVLMIHKFFPLANAYFKALGYNVILTEPTNEDTIALSQQLAQGETCYPVKLIYGHMQQLVDRKVDYIFMPSIHTMKHETSKVAHNYGCVYMQTAPRSIAKILKLDEKGIRLLNPVFDLDFGKQGMAGAMVGLGEILNKPKPMCLAALMSGSAAVRKHEEAVEKMGAELMSGLKPEDKVLVLITRNYGVSDPILNMGIPQILLERGHKLITLSHLPGHDLDISAEYPNLYWPFGQHIISGAKMIARHPNLYAVYLTNHGCGPDSMISHMFKEIMGDKPYLQIEVDEHFSKVGVITRIEAFLNSISHRKAEEIPDNFDIKAVDIRKADLPEKAEKCLDTAIPDFGWYSIMMQAYLKQCGYENVHIAELGSNCREILDKGKAFTSAKEYVSFTALIGSAISEAEKGTAQFIIPQTLGSEADGQYARVIRAELDRTGKDKMKIAVPVLETLPQKAEDFDAFCRAVAAGDIIYSSPYFMRQDYAAKLTGTSEVPAWELLESLAEDIGKLSADGDRLFAVGTPMLITSLQEGVLDALEEQENMQVLRMPLLEYLWMMWMDQQTAEKRTDTDPRLEEIKVHMRTFEEKMAGKGAYSAVPDSLIRTADEELYGFAGANGRYRYAKIQNPPDTCRAVLHVVPRYENTEMILEMRGTADKCPVPFYNLALDGDWDTTAENRLRSFLYYIR